MFSQLFFTPGYIFFHFERPESLIWILGPELRGKSLDFSAGPCGAADNGTFSLLGKGNKNGLPLPCFPPLVFRFWPFYARLGLPHAPTTKTTGQDPARGEEGKNFSLTIIALGFYNSAADPSEKCCDSRRTPSTRTKVIANNKYIHMYIHFPKFSFFLGSNIFLRLAVIVHC